MPGKVKVARRSRRSADDAKAEILKAAERRLKDGGPDAVRVQLVARDVGLTDAAVHHHFGSREGLMAALLRHCARDLRATLQADIAGWRGGVPDLARLADLFADFYERRGYARLALWLSLTGVRDRGAGMLNDLVDALHGIRVERFRHAGRAPPERAETQHLTALIHTVALGDALFGDAMTRSAGLPAGADGRAGLRRFAIQVFERLLAAP